jgi:hypothetical protein
MACHNFVGNGSAPLLLRSAILSTGGYDPGLLEEQGQGCEDLLLQLRIARTYAVAAVPEHLVGYRVGAGTMSRDAEQMRKSWDLVFDRLQADSPPVSPQAVRWAMGMRTFEFAEMRVLAGLPIGGATLLRSCSIRGESACSSPIALRA